METAVVGDVRLSYVRRGRGNPLILLHGYPLDHSIWESISHMLETKFDLILPDLRGFGGSSTIDTAYGVEDMAGDIAGLMDHLGVSKVYLGGHSMGGYVAL